MLQRNHLVNHCHNYTSAVLKAYLSLSCCQCLLPQLQHASDRLLLSSVNGNNQVTTQLVGGSLTVAMPDWRVCQRAGRRAGRQAGLTGHCCCHRHRSIIAMPPSSMMVRSYCCPTIARRTVLRKNKHISRVHIWEMASLP